MGKKLNMTEIFTEEGKAFPATIIQGGSIVATQVKTKASDGYDAVQFGFGEKREKLINKAQNGHTKELGNIRHFKEVKIKAGDKAPARGEKITAEIFKAGDIVAVTSISKGKGHQGVVKRHHFKGGSRTHGQKHSEREAGAIGGGARAGGRVAKGIRMAGRMGGDRVTIKNLTILGVDETGKIFLKGSIPGRRGTLVEITGM